MLPVRAAVGVGRTKERELVSNAQDVVIVTTMLLICTIIDRLPNTSYGIS
jgi:hypothetical protein